MQDNKQPASPTASPGMLVPEVVKDIPIAAPAALRPAQGDEDLDKIMRDVGRDLKQMDGKNKKHHFFSFHSGPKPPKSQKTDAKFSARPIDQIKPAPPSKPAVAPVQRRAQTAAKPAEKPQPKPIKTSRAPVGIILLALMVTGGLAAAAFYAYK